MSRLLSKTFPPLYPKRSFIPKPIARLFAGSSRINDTSNQNEHVTRLLERKAKFYWKIGNYVKHFGYRNAVDSLKRFPKKVESGEEALKLPFIGNRLAAKIDEIIDSGTLKSLDTKRLNAIEKLVRVPGISYDDAKELYGAGITTIEELQKKPHLVSLEQRKALENMDLINMEVPKDEVEQMEKFLQDTLPANVDSRLSITEANRHNRPTVRGMEFILALPSLHAQMKTGGRRHPVLQAVVDELRKSNVVVEDFKPEEKYKFVGLLKLPGKDIPRFTQLDLVSTDVAKRYFSAEI